MTMHHDYRTPEQREARERRNNIITVAALFLFLWLLPFTGVVCMLIETLRT